MNPRNIISTFLKPGSVVFDIGAHIGTLTKEFHGMGYTVHAFEGAGNNAIKFKENCKDLDNITLHEVALNDYEKVTKTRFNDCVGDEHPEIEVHYVEFDKYYAENKLPKLEFIKIDIEGMETVVCKKMTDLIKNIRPVFLIEIHNDKKFRKFRYSEYPSFVSLKEGGFDFKEFEKQGYNAYLYKYGLLMPAKHFRKHAHYFFIPKEKDLEGQPIRKYFLGFKDYSLHKLRVIFNLN